jgi:hypothetical protein
LAYQADVGRIFFFVHSVDSWMPKSDAEIGKNACDV